MPLLPPRAEKLEAIARRFPVIDALSLGTCIWLLRTASSIAESSDAHYARHGLSRGRFHVLILLYQSPAGGLTPAELAEQSGVTRAAMTGQVDALVMAGLVAREADPADRRTYRVRLTDRAFDFLRRFLPVHFKRMARLVANFTDAEKSLLQGLLGQVWANLDAFQADALAHPVGHGLRAPGPASRRGPLRIPRAPRASKRSVPLTR